MKLKSIKSKIIVVVFASVLFTAAALLIISTVSINSLNERDSNQLLEHIGRENAGDINKTLEDIEHSVDNVYYYAYDQLESLFGKLYGVEFRQEYLDKVSMLALSEANGSNNVESVYYRLTTDIKDNPKGFMYLKDQNTGEFKKIELLDISLYDKDDLENVGWYYMAKQAKEPVWIGPYNSGSLGMRMISYVEPIYIYGRFAGVIGMDVNVDIFCEEMENITVYNTGSAVLFDIEDNILYDKDYEHGLEKEKFSTTESTVAAAMRISLENNTPVEYKSSNGMMKLYAIKLVNGMTLCVVAPLNEINSSLHSVLLYSILLGILIMALALAFTYFYIKKLLRPLQELTEVSKQLTDGNMDVSLKYESEDEIGQLSKTFGLMAGSLKKYFDHFHSLAYTDALTGLNNKAAYTITKDVIESEVKMGRAAFSIIVMDVNNLKTINDTIGHEKGDILLQHVTLCLRQTFVGFPLYRIGGDEFCTIINDSSPQDLIDRLQSITAKKSKEDMELFNCPYQIAAGAAVYEKGKDTSFDDVFNRADKAMYENKKYLKEKEKQG